MENSTLLLSGIISAVAILFWITEWIPLYATTVFLWIAIPLFLGGANAKFNLVEVLSWGAHPIVALFFGGFVLSVAAQKYGWDQYFSAFLLKISKGKKNRLLLGILFGTAFLSMWMSNIAAAAMMLMTVRSLFSENKFSSLRKAMLLAVALGANLGGMATPVGTGPNGIAIAALANQFSISFLKWMSFALPLTVLMLLLAYAVLRQLHPLEGNLSRISLKLPKISRQAKFFIVVFGSTIALWLSEPLHNLSAPWVALFAAGILFATRLIDKEDLLKVDWATLLLISGGITFGRLLEVSGLDQFLQSLIPWQQLPHLAIIFLLVAGSAMLSALASNTASAILFIELGRQLDPTPVTTILIALGASFGMPFIISTPPNAMVYAQGGFKIKDFLVPGLILMFLGCALVVFTGPMILKFFLRP